MCPFFITMSSCNILGTCTVHSTKINENFTEGVNSLASEMKNSIYEHIFVIVSVIYIFSTLVPEALYEVKETRGKNRLVTSVANHTSTLD